VFAGDGPSPRLFRNWSWANPDSPRAGRFHALRNSKLKRRPCDWVLREPVSRIYEREDLLAYLDFLAAAFREYGLPPEIR
jgi:hypothetical protein